MESYRLEPPSKLGTLDWSFNKIIHLRRHVASSAASACSIPDEDAYSIHKSKLSQNFSDSSTILLQDLNGFYKDKHQKQQESFFLKEKEAMESFLANLFARISAIKASYVQLQMAESPYDPDMIQSSDLAIVTELKQVSELKQTYFKNQLVIPHPDCDPNRAFAAQIEEQRNLIKTYRITIDKLKADLKIKDSESLTLQDELLESEKNNRVLDSKLHPGRSFSALDDLHPSGLNSTHFLTFLRCTFKSIQSFVKLMEKEMESAGWDLNAAATAIQPEVFQWKKPEHRTSVFESYVCGKMFSNFHHKSFNVDGLEGRLMWSSPEFFQEFTQLRCVEQIQKLSQHSAISSFIRAKYLELVHQKMEESFFGSLNHRAVLSSCQRFPNSTFFKHFVEMARGVWLLHCLFFSFKQDSDQSIFQAQRGSRFSEVYMESVVIDDKSSNKPSTVGFTVVPGFKVCSTLIQCKVYLSPADQCS
ncbi:protein GRAVITROPIC IN THE LIGHT 1-like [Zingiber officinale]|uniref:DUF641 domain-containing protein n=1 Tax=Zingiber officinale TaxID=94328 RepID=A0A8J5HYI4_ZINOF|nr:protein GRAVITROPIC IN THE LIGHT 1-like [Zingiber officinale]XP_042453841.1 protein GRAVITROPIC IN THE LIGHT 1-like [Zingiber officinale]XP_042453842.1 protein GRAVITROPIC IN THE LIGHT 1-like [Zingiber officinale]KAG6538357.1 hypothetical protein ZIOFF_003472 [Zingiber officinale]